MALGESPQGHGGDHEMIRQIESKVVNRLRQVTSAIRQDGANQVSIIASTAERQAAVEFGKAAAVRPEIVGEALKEITRDEELAKVLFKILDYEKMLESNAKVVVVPAAGEMLPQLLAAGVKPGEVAVAAGASTPSTGDSTDRTTAVGVGSRRGEAIVLEVAAGEMHRAGHKFFQSANGVWLTDGVPPEYLKILEGKLSRAGEVP